MLTTQEKAEHALRSLETGLAFERLKGVDRLLGRDCLLGRDNFTLEIPQRAQEAEEDRCAVER
jgi:hypothetical protein